MSIGNLGYAKAVCTHQFIDVNQEISHKCAKGKLSELKFYGLAPHILNKPKQLTDETHHDYCSSHTKNPQIKQCT